MLRQLPLLLSNQLSGGPETPRLGTFESPAQDSPKATDPLFVRSYSPGPGLGVRDSLQPSPSFMSAGASRHDSYQSYDSGMPFAGDKRASQASGVSLSNCIAKISHKQLM